MRTKRIRVNRIYCVLASVTHRVAITAVLAVVIRLHIILTIIIINIPHIINRNRLSSRRPFMPGTAVWAWLGNTVSTAIQKTS